MSSIESLKERARRHEQREEWREALDLYRKAIARHEEDDQLDFGLYNRIGDLQTRLGNLEAAAEAYERTVDLYAESELPNNAIAVCKKIIRHLPGRAGVYLRMGQIRAKQGFLVDARQSFLTYAERMQSRGDIDEAFRALIEFADLAPEDTEIRLAIAAQMQQHERRDEALEQLAIGYGTLVARGREEEAEVFEEQIREIDPEADPQELAAGARAATDAVTARTATGLGEVGSGLTDIELGAPPEPHTLSPRPATPSSAEAGEPVEIGGEDLELRLDGGDETAEGDTLEGFQPTALGGFGEEEAPPAGMEELEADVVPEEVAGASPPGGTGEGDEGADAALEELEALSAEIGGGLEGLDIDLEEARPPEEEARAEPREEALEPLSPTGFEDEESGQEEAPPLPLLGEDEPELEGPWAGEPEPEPEPKPEPGVERAAGSGPAEPAEAEEDVVLDLQAAVQEAAQEAAEEAAAAARAEEAREADTVAEAERLAAEGDVAGALELARGLVEDEPDDVPHRQRVVELAFRAGDDEVLVDAYLGLATCLERNDQDAQARAVYQQVLSVAPDNATAREALRGAGAEGSPVQEVASSEDYVDLGALILDEEEDEKTTRFVVAYEEPSGDEAADFARMLNQFKKKVSENVSADDVRAHHDLGTAYKEMGLYDEAIQEYQQALRASSGHLPTYELLGQCFMERGEHDAAIRSLSRALEFSQVVEDELIGIYYYLGRAHEAVGNTGSAVEFYDRVFTLDINFADVTERLRALR